MVETIRPSFSLSTPPMDQWSSRSLSDRSHSPRPPDRQRRRSTADGPGPPASASKKRWRGRGPPSPTWSNLVQSGPDTSRDGARCFGMTHSSTNQHEVGQFRICFCARGIRTDSSLISMGQVLMPLQRINMSGGWILGTGCGSTGSTQCLPALSQCFST